MPLVRAEVRNENALGAPELYREVNKEDPKEILEGVSVAGLVGVLRQLGDLAEFAAEVFHGLQEEAMRTSSRSHKLMARVKQVETSLSPLEKALLAQRSHLHFAYTAGFNWHTRIQCKQNHFIYSDMPQFIMDSYDDCRVPPCLQLLDKFDSSGPGSCLKRYSDPTFFSRASVASDDAIGYKPSKDKKVCKIKKRSWTRSRDVSRDASFAYCSGRLLFARTNVDGKSSSSQTSSAYDTTQRSDFHEQTTSTLRNGSGYSEGYFYPANSVLPEEREFRESVSSAVKGQESDVIDYNIVEGKIRDAYHDIQIYPSRDPAGFSSSSVTLNEKNSYNDDDVKRMEHKTQSSENDGITSGNNHSGHLESFSLVLDEEFPGCKVEDIEIADNMDSELCNQVVGAPESTDSPPHDIDSEIDHFMDALNTIESGCETDTDYTEKEQMKPSPKLEDTSVKEEISEIVRHDVECQYWNSVSNIVAESSLINGGCDNNLISLSPKSHHAAKSTADEFNVSFLVDKDLQSSQMARGSLTPGIPKSVNSNDIDRSDGGNTLDSVLCTIPSNIMDHLPEMSITNGTRMGLDSKKHVPETSTVTPITFWTNGGLLGLQPSKPPDFSVQSSPDQDFALTKEVKISSSTQQVINSDNTTSHTEILKHSEDNFSMDSLTSDTNQVSGSSVTKTLWKLPPADLDIKLGMSCDPNHWNSRADIPSGSAIALSRMIELSNNCLSTGDNKKVLSGENKKNSAIVHHNTNAFEEKNCVAMANHTICGQNKYLFSGKSSVISPSSSPPLAHMKISFQAINNFETLKLKLKCPSGSTDSGGDVFPSFQLVPEVSIAHPNICSDSDADTFYRSSPSLSDDSHSNQWSGSNSEQWDSSESPTGKDCEIYDALQRISVSTVLENGYEEFPFVDNWSGNTGTGCSFDTRNLGTKAGSSGKEQIKNDILSPKGVVGLQQFVVMPDPPPPPPVHWHKSDTIAKGSRCEFGFMCSENTVSQPKPAPLEDQFDTMHMRKSKSSKEMNQAKSMDEDFFHQPRTKSFNLRPTVPTKPTVAAANVQVNAILEKANAIRQAVASDGDDDGNWSET